MAWTQRRYPALVLLCLLAACGGRTTDDGGLGGGDGGVDGGLGSGDAGMGSGDGEVDGGDGGVDGGMDGGDGGVDGGMDGGDAGMDGGDGGDVPVAVIFSPSILTETYGSGDSTNLIVEATIATPLSGDVYLAVIDNAGVLEGRVRIEPDQGAYVASAWTSSKLPVGRYQGTLEVWLCRDTGCSAHHPGSPSYLPYDLQVIPGTNLTPLTRWPSVRDWETFQGTPAHTGYVPVTLDPSKFSPRWSWKSPESSFAVSPPVIANGLVYVANYLSYRDPWDPTRNLFVLRESDKGTEWQFDFGSWYQLSPPAVSGGKVFVATTDGLDGYLWSFDAATGARLSTTFSDSRWGSYYAPTIDGDGVYTTCGHSGGMCAFSFANGARNWFAELPSWTDRWTPAVDENYAYSYVRGVLSALVKSTGKAAFTITDPAFEGDSNGIPGTPVLGRSGAVFAVSSTNGYHDNHLVSFNTTRRDLNWSVPGRYAGNPVLAKEVVYAMTLPAGTQRLTLEARNATTGALLWSWTQPLGAQERNGDLLVTDNLIFVSTTRHVYAVDLVTHALVWSYWRGGNVALSANGVLYIASGNTLGAVNLK